MTVDELALRSIEVKAREVMAMAGVHPSALKATADFFGEALAETIMVKLRCTFPGSERTEQNFFEVPLTWWDALKARLGMRFRKRTITQQVTHVYICPHTEIHGLGQCGVKHLYWMEEGGAGACSGSES